MTSAPSERQLRSQLEATLKKSGPCHLVAFYSTADYQGRTEISAGGGVFQVKVAESSLHFHHLAALAEAKQGHFLVLCPNRDWLTQDIKDRLPHRQLQELDPWESLREQFSAEQVDARLKSDKSQRKLADWLLECDSQDFPKAPSGILTLDFAVETLLLLRLRLTGECLDPVYLLMSLVRLGDFQPQDYGDDFSEFVIDWFRQRSGGAAHGSSRTKSGQSPSLSPTGEPGRGGSGVQSPSDTLAQGKEAERLREEPLAAHRSGGAQTEVLLQLFLRYGASETLAFALMFESVFARPGEPDSLVAQGRLERYLEGRPLGPGVGRALAKNVVEFVRLSDSWDWLPGAATRARQRLSEILAPQLASHSLILEEGWDRLIREATEGANKFSQLAQHHLFARRQDDVEQLRMVYRIQAFLSAPPSSPEQASLGQLLRFYHEEIAWLDRARNWLSYEHAVLGKDFRDSRLSVQPWREEFNRQFALALQQANGSPAQLIPLKGETRVTPPSVPRGFLLVEEFLEQLVRPLLEKRKILMVVLDGCSQATLLDVLDSLDGLNWSHYRPESPDHQRLLSALPSVTEVARASLFSGTLCQGPAEVEKRNFRVRFPKASLHHKAQMQQAVEEARSEEHPLVAVVVNTIDDTLAKEDQLDLRWTSKLIAPLEPLLDAARMAQRLVLLVSDHGHQLDCGTQELPAKDGGNRWQPFRTVSGRSKSMDASQTNTETSRAQHVAGALVLEGGRLQMADSAQLLYREDLRFGPRKRGYHGGISPQEMCCALALLAPSASTVPRWVEESRKPPSWWHVGRRQRPKIHLPPKGQGLFDEVLSERLLQHPVFLDRVGRPPHLAQLVDELYLSDYSREELSQRLGLSRTQLNQLVPLWSRWLNINGLMLLRSDTNSVWLEASVVQQLLGG